MNGTRREAPDGVTPTALLESLGLSPGRVAIEVNGRVVRRSDLGELRLRDGDVVVIVQFVGGGCWPSRSAVRARRARR